MRWLAGVAAIIAAVVDILYVGILISQSARRPRDPLGLTVIFVTTFIAILALSACRATGVGTGSGSGIVSVPYHYTCVNGKLTIYPGACNSGGESYDANGNVISVTTC